MRNIVNFSAGLLAGVLLFVFPTVSYAKREDQHKQYQSSWRHASSGYKKGHSYYDRHPKWGMTFSLLPSSFFTVNLGTNRYYYDDGFYYERFGGGYVLVAPPLGARVHSLPRGYRIKVIGGRRYYYDNGTYYLYSNRSYQVVSAPVEVPGPKLINSPAISTVAREMNVLSAVSDATESFTVNIPDNRGGYISVVLKQSDKGFVGPQGEFYSEFPKVSQLKVMYGN